MTSFAFDVGELRFVTVEVPAKRLAIFKDGVRRVTLMPPAEVEWTPKAVRTWVEEEFLPTVAEGC